MSNNIDNEDNATINSKPYMGDLTSSQIGYLASTGKLGGEMVKRMVESVEHQMANTDTNLNQLK